MSLANSTYHSLLRTSALVVAIMLAFVSGLFSPVTAELAQTTERYVASVVGVTVGVAPTELNTVTAELTARERALDERELALSEREIAVGIESGARPPLRADTFILATILFILLTLIIINYVLDFARGRASQVGSVHTTPNHSTS